MKRKIVIAATATALVVGGAVTAYAASGDDSVPAAEVTAAEALKIAQEKVPGSVESAERDDEGGGDWEIGIRSADGRDHEVRVDASSGAVLDSRVDGADDTGSADDENNENGEKNQKDQKDENREGGSGQEAREDAEGAGDGEEGAEGTDAPDSALPRPEVTAQRAADAALALRSGTVTEIEFDDARWEVEVRTDDGASHDILVDPRTAEATAAPGSDD
ncbi:PepSY domain-containing protein [Streptomyces sp. NPDC051018]|uniref:PepSY domain-containing protein n=1 Tax=Streptomyces sp. NPDC051018 TaxID=3365639 RepID=UPI003789DC14